MKTFHWHPVLIACAIMVLAGAPRSEATEPQGRFPVLDTQGRFWVYRNGPNHPKMPFTPYAWMSDSSNDLTRIIQVDLESRDRPCLDLNSTVPEKETCIRMRINWGNATWVNVGFISGPDDPPWWGDTDKGRHFNLTGLSKKRLVFYARGAHGGESIRAQIGVLYDKPYGDSVSKPIRGEELKLSGDWTRYELDLKNLPDAELAAICNGFSIFVERASQPGSTSDTQFFIDDVYYE